jgi:hypothetical protein
VLDADHVKPDPQDLTTAGDWTMGSRTLYTFFPTTGGNFIFNGIWNIKDAALSFSVIPHLYQVIANGGLLVTKVVGQTDTYYTLTTPNYLYDYDGNPPHPTLSGAQIPLPKICRYDSGVLIPDGLLALWDLGDPPTIANATKVENALFYGNGDNYSVIAKNVTLEENNQRYILVCAAEGLAYAVKRLREGFCVNGLKNRASPADPAHFL